jgi:hypothetical protein
MIPQGLAEMQLSYLLGGLGASVANCRFYDYPFSSSGHPERHSRGG